MHAREQFDFFRCGAISTCIVACALTVSAAREASAAAPEVWNAARAAQRPQPSGSGDPLGQGQQDEASRGRERQQVLDIATTEVAHVPRWMMFVPLGFGQFENESSGLGALFAAVESLSLTTAVAVYTFNDAWLPASCHQPSDGLIARNCEAPLIAVNIVAWSVFGLALVGGVLQANLAYQPDRVTTHRRPVPPVLEHIQISADPRGLGLGVTLRF